jgi:hypothetical protein
MAQSYHERFVRLYWKSPKTGFEDGDSYKSDIWSVDLGSKHIWSSEHRLMWEDAADYTRMILRMIEEAEEQYYWLLHGTKFSAITLEQVRARKYLINELNLKLQSLKMELTI